MELLYIDLSVWLENEPTGKYQIKISRLCIDFSRRFGRKRSQFWGDLGWELTHWGLVMHICVNKVTNIGSDNGLSPGRRQAIIWTNAGILLIGPLGQTFVKS